MDVDELAPPHSPSANGVLPPPLLSSSPTSLKHALPRDDDGQPQKKQKTQPAEDRPLRVHIPSTPSRSPSHAPTSRASHPSPPPSAPVDSLRLQLHRLHEWQDRARAEIDALQRSLDDATPIALLTHPAPPVQPFHALDASLGGGAAGPSPNAPGMTVPQSPATSAAGGVGYGLPAFYRSSTEPFHPPYSAAPSPLVSASPSPFPFPPSTPSLSLGSPTAPSSSSASSSSSLALLSLEQLEARKQQLHALISGYQRTAGAVLPLGAEPPRNKTHWDYVLQEAMWMSGDFQREKRWKVKVAKKISRGVLQYWARLKEKDARERKAELARRRKLCAGIAREVRKFWANIGKLVRYKHQSVVDKEKKEAMQRHLDILVDQTANYSTQLASSLTKAGGSMGGEGKEAPSIAEAAKEEEGKEGGGGKMGDGGGEEEEGLDDILNGLNGGPSSDGVRRSGRTGMRKAVVGEEGMGVDDKADEDFDEGGESSEDDEETLEEEEEQEENEADGDVDVRQQEEVNALNEEAEMTIEQLKAKYGIGAAAEESEGEEEDEEEEEGEEEEEEGEGQEDGDGDRSEAAAMEDAIIPESPEASPASSLTSSSSSSPTPSTTPEEARITAAASLASSAQPTGHTLSTHTMHTQVPFLLRGSLREYQAVGLDWLASMYEHGLNGILADEMGLGKTVMTIALLGWLACTKEVWGQHLIIVPTSVMINWEMEFKRWLPSLRILCYHGSAKERKDKRRGWMDPNSFHVCITSYQVVLQDALLFKRKRWVYLVLDEAQHIKNFKSQRWQTLLAFNTQRRLLLTGTPLQNSVMELWSLMHFLMPAVFQSQREFREWFSIPVESMMEGKQQLNSALISRLHTILRPFILRRLKSAVATQLPAKHEHTITCRLSKRQREYYEDFMAASDTRRILSSGNFIGMMNVLMQLRKTCCHPDLFQERAIVTPFDVVDGLQLQVASVAVDIVRHDEEDQRSEQGSALHHFVYFRHHTLRSRMLALDVEQLQVRRDVIEDVTNDVYHPQHPSYPTIIALPTAAESDAILQAKISEVKAARLAWRGEARLRMNRENHRRCNVLPLIADDDHLIRLLTVIRPVRAVHEAMSSASASSLPRHALLTYPELRSSQLAASPPLLLTLEQRVEVCVPLITGFTCIIPRARAPPASLFFWHASPSPSTPSHASLSPPSTAILHSAISPLTTLFRPSFIRHQLSFPDKLLLQFDCGKLQVLDRMLRTLHAQHHRCLIFTQFTRMLDILEHFLSIYSYTYLRLDGSTKPEERQRLMEKFNQTNKYFLMLLSTRSGGVGVNLTGADTVIFYDSDWSDSRAANCSPCSSLSGVILTHSLCHDLCVGILPWTCRRRTAATASGRCAR